MQTMATATNGADITAELRQRLTVFRTSHPRQRVTLGGAEWSYLLGGHDTQGGDAFLILPGGERIGDLAFTLMQHLESEYRCLYPAYPPLSTMAALVDGLAAMLDQLSIQRVILFGASFGGDVAQCFVRKYPDRVSRMILLNTGIPDEPLGRATMRGKPLVTLLPLGLLRSLISAGLVRVLSTRPEEQAFWRAMLRELIGQLTRADMVASFDDSIDYRLQYQFAPSDLASWPGKALVLQSDDDPAVRPPMRQALRDLYPQAEAHTFHRAGHTPFLSQPDEFYPRLWAFLRQP